ncbi:glycosyl hydrolase family 18 protein [candidate division KSB1 bacterium]|nr:glycosyl hydrolase family 18 protein [candidate division KSB1 bacterium]
MSKILKNSMRLVTILNLIGSFILGMPMIATTANYKIVGYYMGWNRATFSHQKVDFKNLTHLMHAFIWPNADGSLEIPSGIVYPELIAKAHQSGVKVLISLGGWGQCAGFAPMAANTTSRSQFVTNIINFCRQHQYDGIDLDWEYPEQPIDRANMTRLAQDLRIAMDAVDSTWLLTAAVPAGNWSANHFDLISLNRYLDWFGCMTYDFHGSWSTHAGHNAPLYAPATDAEGSVDLSIKFLLNLGLPASKILLGLPFYGYEFTAKDWYQPSTGGVAIEYKKIIPRIGNGWTYHWDNVAQVPYLKNTSQTRLVTFDDTVSVKIKTEYAVNKKLAGIMIWALGQDEINSKQTLLTTLGRHFRTISECEDSSNGSSLNYPQHLLQPNYPNPFNAHTNIDYFVATPGRMRLEVLNLLGHPIALLINENQNRGWQHTTFNAGKLASGFYYYRLTARDFSKSGRMLVLK